MAAPTVTNQRFILQVTYFQLPMCMFLFLLLRYINSSFFGKKLSCRSTLLEYYLIKSNQSNFMFTDILRHLKCPSLLLHTLLSIHVGTQKYTQLQAQDYHNITNKKPVTRTRITSYFNKEEKTFQVLFSLQPSLTRTKILSNTQQKLCVSASKI